MWSERECVIPPELLYVTATVNAWPSSGREFMYLAGGALSFLLRQLNTYVYQNGTKARSGYDALKEKREELHVFIALKDRFVVIMH